MATYSFSRLSSGTVKVVTDTDTYFIPGDCKVDPNDSLNRIIITDRYGKKLELDSAGDTINSAGSPVTGTATEIAEVLATTTFFKSSGGGSSADDITQGTFSGTNTFSYSNDASGTSYNTPTITVRRLATGTSAAPLVTALFRNTSEVAGGSDYQNEVHIRLQAGTSADHRKYLNFAGYDGVDQWVTGVNALKDFPLYDAIDVLHRMYLRVDANGGHSEYRSVGTGKVIFNQSASGETAAGTGGVEIWSGGSTASQRANFKLTPNGFEYYPDATRRFYLDVNGAMLNVASSGSIYKGQNASGTKFEITNAGETGFNTSASPSNYQNFFNTTASPTSGSFASIQSTYAFAPASDNTSGVYGINSTVSSSTANRARINSFFASVTSTNTGANSEMNAYNANMIYSGVGTMPSMKGLNLTLNATNASSIVTNLYGIHVNAPSNSGSIGNVYGLRIDGQKVGTISGSAYAIYQAGANDKSYFAGQVGFNNTTPAASALVDMASTTQGFLPPRMTTTQRDAIISPATGLTIYCTDATAGDASTGSLQTYNGSTWKNHW